MLTVQNLTVAYGSITAVKDVSFEVGEGEIVVLAGANGAGKSTLLKTISGLMSPISGEIQFKGKRISGWPAHRIASTGLLHVPEGRRIWPALKVRDHLELAWHKASARQRNSIRQEIDVLFPRLAERWGQPAGQLSGGEQQMLAIARGLAGQPTLLMIDELSLGLAPAVVKQLFRALKRINETGVTLILVEQALAQALQIVHHGFVLEAGQLVLEGTAQELRDNEQVRRAYLSV